MLPPRIFGPLAALLSLALLSDALAATVWTATGPVEGAYTTVAYSFDGTRAFAGGIGVVFTSTDDGAHWKAEALPAAFAHSIVLAIAPDPKNADIVLVSTYDLGLETTAGDAVLVSADAGVTWKAGAGLPNQISSGNTQFPYNITWDPNTSTTAYASTAAGETGDIYRTTDAGKTWALRYFANTTSNPIPFGAILAVPTKPTALYLAASDFNYSQDGDEYIAKSTDGAAAFTDVDPLNYVGYSGYGNVITRFAYDPKKPSTVYTLVSGIQTDTLNDLAPYIQVQWTPNGGVNWVNHVKGLPINTQASTITVDPASSDVLLPVCCAAHHQLFASANQGDTWTVRGTIPASSAALVVKPGIAAAKPATLLNAGHGGVLLSSDGGKTWADRNTGLTQPNFTDVVVDPKATGQVYIGTRNGVWVSSNGGAAFRPISTGLTDENVQAIALDTKAAVPALYAATTSGIYVCKNPAATKPVWTDITPPAMAKLTGIYALALDGSTAGRLYVSNTSAILLASGNTTQREIFRTDDFGAHWVTTGFNAATGNDFPEAMVADPSHPGTLYAVSGDFPGVWKSTNAGKTFTEVLNGSGGTRLAIGAGTSLNPRTLYLKSTDPNSGQPTIFRSTDNGTTWDNNTAGAPGGGQLLDIATAPTGSTLYALAAFSVTSPPGVRLALYESPNRGFTWTDITGNLPAEIEVNASGALATPAFFRVTGNKIVVGEPVKATLEMTVVK
jgi:photosystem II stability/assembly factor-like uncharacterized protein